MKIAKIFSGNILNQKGKFNNVIDRIKYFKQYSNQEMDVYLIQKKPSWLFKKLKKSKIKLEDTSVVDDITIHNIWIKQSVLEYALVHLLKINDVVGKTQIKKYVPLFKNYDLLSAHGELDGYLAYYVKNKYKIPYVNTWHGSDINVYPFRSKKAFKLIKQIIEYADYNFFVSKKLLEKSNEITLEGNKTHLYTGPSEFFKIQSDEEKQSTIEKLRLNTKYKIGFIGNLKPIKNVNVLPEIFFSVQSKIKDVGFVIVGDGSLMLNLKAEIQRYKVENVVFMGSVSAKEVPSVMNVLKLMVLPSLNEGLPLVTLEAQKCGVHVVGSNAGGIEESIIKKNVIPLGNDFVERFSNRIIEILENNEPLPRYPKEFDWFETVKKELEIYSSIIKQ